MLEDVTTGHRRNSGSVNLAGEGRQNGSRSLAAPYCEQSSRSPCASHHRAARFAERIRAARLALANAQHGSSGTSAGLGGAGCGRFSHGGIGLDSAKAPIEGLRINSPAQRLLKASRATVQALPAGPRFSSALS